MEKIEPRLLLNAFIDSTGKLNVNGDELVAGFPDTITLKRTIAGATLVRVSINGTSKGDFSMANVTNGAQINGLGGDDTLIVDSSNGQISFHGGIKYDGGTGSNRIVFNGSADSAGYSPGFAGSGTISHTKGGISQSVSFINVTTSAGAITDTTVCSSMTVTGTATFGENFSITDGASAFDGLLQFNYSVPNHFVILPPVSSPPLAFSNKQVFHLETEPAADFYIEAGLFLYGSTDNVTLAFDEIPTGVSSINVDTRQANDSVQVQAIAIPTAINTGSGDDSIVVGNSAHRANGIASTLSITDSPDPDEAIVSPGNGTNTLTIDDTGNVGGSGFIIHATSISGTSMPGIINYHDMDTLTINTGSGNDEFDVRDTAATVQTVLNGNGGDDRFRMGSAGSGSTKSTLSTTRLILGRVAANGGSGVDTVLLDDAGSTRDTTIVVTSTAVAGLEMGIGVTYAGGDLENLTIFGGIGNDLLQDHRDVPLGDRIPPLPNIAGSNLGGQPGDGVAFYGTSGNDTILIARPVAGQILFRLNGHDVIDQVAGCSTISVFAGAGDDLVQFDASAANNWKANFYGEDGNDALVGGNLDDILDGGKGNDSLNGSLGNDILVGDQGHDILIGGGGNDVLIKSKDKAGLATA